MTKGTPYLFGDPQLSSFDRLQDQCNAQTRKRVVSCWSRVSLAVRGMSASLLCAWEVANDVYRSSFYCKRTSFLESSRQRWGDTLRVKRRNRTFLRMIVVVMGKRPNVTTMVKTCTPYIDPSQFCARSPNASRRVFHKAVWVWTNAPTHVCTTTDFLRRAGATSRRRGFTTSLDPQQWHLVEGAQQAPPRRS